MAPARRNGFGAPERPWKTMLMGLLIAGLAAVVYFYLSYLEDQSLRTGAAFRVNWLLALLYNTGGKSLAAGFFLLAGLVTFGAGAVRMARRDEAPPNMPMPRSALNATLMPALDFTGDDLAANRQGLLTGRQRSRLAGLRRQSSVGILASGLIAMLAIGGIGAYVLFFVPTSAALMRDPTTRTLVPLVLGAVLLVIFGSLLVAALRSARLATGGVKVAEGPVNLVARSMSIEAAAVSQALGYGSHACAIQVGGVTFPVKEMVLEAFKQGAIYRFYYVKYAPTHILLSAEALGDA